jgi:hypothetical protein
MIVSFFTYRALKLNISAIFYIKRNSIFIKVIVAIFSLNIFIKCKNYNLIYRTDLFKISNLVWAKIIF